MTRKGHEGNGWKNRGCCASMRRQRGSEKKHEDKCRIVTGPKKRGQGRREHSEKDAGGLHACLKTISCAAF